MCIILTMSRYIEKINSLKWNWWCFQELVSWVCVWEPRFLGVGNAEWLVVTHSKAWFCHQPRLTLDVYRLRVVWPSRCYFPLLRPPVGPSQEHQRGFLKVLSDPGSAVGWGWQAPPPQPQGRTAALIVWDTLLSWLVSPGRWNFALFLFYCRLSKAGSNGCLFTFVILKGIFSK